MVNSLRDLPLLLGVGMAAKPPRAVTARDAYLDEVSFVDMGWTGSIVPGGPNYTFTGTVQDIVSQIQEIDPSMLSYIHVGSLTSPEIAWCHFPLFISSSSATISLLHNVCSRWTSSRVANCNIIASPQTTSSPK